MWLRRTMAVLVVALIAAAGAAVAAIKFTPLPSLDRAALISPTVLARDGRILRAYLAPDERWRFAVVPADVSKNYIDTLIAYEDKRFYRHIGVDVFALARVCWGFVRHGRAVSGASTLTMQVVKLLNPGLSGVRGKLIQIIGAIQIERRLAKQDILALYLTLAPFGGNIEGIRAASLFYFGKEPANLSLDESALLVAVAQSPARRRPDRHPIGAREGRNKVLDRLRHHCALAECIDPASNTTTIGYYPFLAPHLADRVRKLSSRAPVITTTVDADLQAQIESTVKQALQAWPANVNAAALVIRNSDAAVLAYVGGSNFFSQDDAAQFDLVRAVRSPGSTLKPMIYGLGFEALVIHPNTIISDKPVNFDGYAPQNFNEEYQGDMTIREALIKSINTTAVSVLARITPMALLTRLRSADLAIQIKDTDVTAGLAVALGGGGTTLETLTRIFSGISNHGRARPLKLIADAPIPQSKKLMNEDAAWAIADILGDMPPPPGFGPRQTRDGGRRIAYKTGTSFGYRDAWAVGFDRDYAVGVWLGRSDAAPNPGALGLTAAAPMLYRIFDVLPAPEGDVAGLPSAHNPFASRVVPPRLYRFSGAPGAQLQSLRILFPRRGAVIVAERDGDGAPFVPLVADGGDPPYFWFVDNVLLPDSDAKIRWRPNGVGLVAAKLMDSRGAVTETEFSIE
jgi:penicillin-binding protein 1C